jgi:hypothetical protein
VIGSSGETLSRRVISKLKSGKIIGVNLRLVFKSDFVLGRFVPLFVRLFIMSLGIVIDVFWVRNR